MKIHELLNEAVAGPKKCWPGHRKVGTQPGTGKNKGKRVNDCEKIKEDEVTENFGNYYNENIASKVFSQYPDLTSEDDVLSAAWEHVVRDMGRKKAGHLFNYDEDFPSDLVSSYFYLKKQDAVKESGLQYYTGVKKHGEKYMKAAAAAGRDGASQEELGALKDKLSKAHKGKDNNEDIEEAAKKAELGQEDPQANKAATEDVTKKLSGATPAPAPNPYLKDILMQHIDEVRHFVQTGYFDPTKPLFQELYEYFANEIPESVRRNPGRLVRRIGDMIAPYAKFYANQKLMNGQGTAEGIDDLARILELSGLNLSADEQFDIIEDMVESLALQHGVDTEIIWEDLESVDDQELLDEAAAWRTSKGKSKTGGLNAKGVASYRRENPGSKLQMAVTTKPSKLKPGSKAAKRRKSFCARMGGMKGPMKKPNGKPTRKALALRKWNC